MKDGLANLLRTVIGSLCISANSGHLGAVVVKMAAIKASVYQCKGLFKFF